MAGRLIFSKDEIRFLEELTRNGVEFMLVGLSAAALQGAPVVTQDVDLWFRDLDDPGIRKSLKAVGGAYVPSIGLNPPMFEGKGVGLFDILVHMHGLADFDEEKMRAVRLALGKAKLAVLPLDRIVKSKKATGRVKDKLAVRVLLHAMKAKADAAGKKRGERLGKKTGRRAIAVPH